MSQLEWATLGSTAELRRSFDASFAAPRPAPAVAGERLLGVRLAGERFALPLAGKSVRLSGLAVDRLTAPLPSPFPGFLGLVGVRGEIFPAFDLAALAGLSGGGRRWLALLRLPAPAALAFEDLEQLIEIPASDLMPMMSGDLDAAGLSLVTRIAHREDRLLPVLDLDAIADAIRRISAPGT